MKMLRLSAIASALTLFVAVPAFAQAPISQGRTSSTAQLQASNAELRLKITDLEAENARLTGEIETLQFLLTNSQDDINRLQEDDQEIARQLKSLNSRISKLGRRVKQLEESGAATTTSRRYVTSSRPSNAAENADASPPPTQTVTRTVTTNSGGPRVISRGPRTITTVNSAKAGPDSGGAGASTASNQTANDNATVTVDTADNPEQTGSLGTIAASDLPGDAGPLFAEAKSRLTKFDHAGAEEAFRAFLEQFGGDPQAGEAQYWLGETLYQQGAYAEAGAAYTKMIQTYPDDLRAPDALVKLARAMRLVGESERACAALGALPKRYPNASAVTKNLAAVEATRASCG